ncbi:hypothetical protein BMT55_08135 [Listeria newyorkensis]|uniref:Lipoprotein n=1 Tax=Listeria newyorkensis TaxID=1497681 RepID=A0ABX4XM53_9LIST|nr:hypothetical protein [Listeria newyorkensis]PNP92528.1 hypothetical protein BMT55_08135 [Listeria newyorkensis]
MKLIKIGTLSMIILLLASCTPTQEIVDTGGNNTVTNQTNNNNELVVEWAPLYTNSEKPIIDVYDLNFQDALYDTKILMFSNLSTKDKVTLTTNGGGYIGDGEPTGTFFLLALITNRTDKKITNLRYDIKVILNKDGTVLGESGFDIPSDVYGDYIEPNKGYAAFLPFPDNNNGESGVNYTRYEITVYQEISYDTVEE